MNDSILAHIGSVIAPIFVPLGWGDWKMAVAAVTGLIAKENVVGTFGILFGFAEVNADNGIEIWGTACRKYDSGCGLLILSVQPSLCALLCGDGSD